MTVDVVGLVFQQLAVGYRSGRHDVDVGQI